LTMALSVLLLTMALSVLLLTMALSVLLWFTTSDYLFGIFNTFLFGEESVLTIIAWKLGLFSLSRV
jgi:hypothetical protein